MEWIADNLLYEDFLSENRLRFLMAACEDVFSVGCWLKLLELGRNSTQLSLDDKIGIYKLACCSIGHDLSSGHKIWLASIDFFDEVEEEVKIKHPKSNPLVDRTIIEALEIPFVNYDDVSEQLISDYQPEDTVPVIELTRKHQEQIAKLESLCADPAASKDVYLELCAFLKTHYPRRNNLEMIWALYRRWLSRHPQDTKTWLHLAKKELQGFIDERQKALNRARRSNPGDVRFWTGQLLDRTFGSVPPILVPGNQRPLSLESAKEYTVEYVASLKRLFTDDHDIFNWGKFEAESRKLAANLTGHPELQSTVLISMASIQARTQSQFCIFAEIQQQCDNEFAYWFEQAKCNTGFNHDMTRKCFFEASRLWKPLYTSFLDTWLDFARVHEPEQTFIEIYDNIEGLRGQMHREGRESSKRPEYQEKTVAEKIESKRPRVEEPGPTPLVVDLAPKAELSVHVANIDFSVTDAQLSAFFQEHAGPVQAVHMGRKASGESRGFASVEFKEAASVQKAIQLDRSRLQGRPLFISRHQTVGSSSWKPAVSHPRGRDPCTLYVSQLSAETVEEDLRVLFSTHGSLKGVRLGLEKNGLCKGYAYVEFEDEQTASRALAEHGKIVNDQAISVLISDPSLAPKKQTQKMAMVPPSLSRPKPKARLNLK